MSDEQATKMIELLTEIRDELRLVRDTVAPGLDDAAKLQSRLRSATSAFDLARSRIKWSEEHYKDIQPINAVASQRVLVPETP